MSGFGNKGTTQFLFSLLQRWVMREDQGEWIERPMVGHVHLHALAALDCIRGEGDKNWSCVRKAKDEESALL